MYQTNGQTFQNYAFKQELSQNLTCEGLSKVDFENTDYFKRDLEKLFIKYNKCSDPDYVNHTTQKKRSLFNLTVRPGMSITNIILQNAQADYLNTDFNNKLGFRFGVEAEYILAFNKKKWAIIVEPTYQFLFTEQSKNTNNPSYGIINSSIEYQSIELPVGGRYYIFLKNDSKIFVNAFGVFDYSFNSSVKFKRGSGSDLSNPLEINSRLGLAVGVGYKVKNKIGVEIRYQNRDILSNYIMWEGKYSSALVILGYTF